MSVAGRRAHPLNPPPDMPNLRTGPYHASSKGPVRPSGRPPRCTGEVGEDVITLQWHPASKSVICLESRDAFASVGRSGDPAPIVPRSRSERGLAWAGRGEAKPVARIELHSVAPAATMPPGATPEPRRTGPARPTDRDDAAQAVLNPPSTVTLPSPPPTATDPVKRLLPWLVAVAFFMESLDTTILNTALPAMANALHVAPLSMKSVLTSYTLSLAVFIPGQRLGGRSLRNAARLRLGDRHLHPRVAPLRDVQRPAPPRRLPHPCKAAAGR